jgi:hypothetical protein
MNIKIIGSNCSNGIKLFKSAIKLADDNKEEINIQKLDDVESMKKYGIKNIPGLIVNDKLISEGKVLTPKEILKSA